jgi:hypothetical protein
MDTSILDGLPGGTLVRRGLEEYARGEKTAGSLAVRIAAPRLREAGLLPLNRDTGGETAELDLYQLFAGEEDPFSCYRCLLQDLTSLENALDHRIRRQNIT